MALSLAILTGFSQIDTDVRYRLPAELILIILVPQGAIGLFTFLTGNKIRNYIKRNAFLYHSLISIKGFLIGLGGIVKRQKGAREHLLSTSSFFIKSDNVFGMPVNISIEPINVCNLRCPVCETGNGTLNRENKISKTFLKRQNLNKYKN